MTEPAGAPQIMNFDELLGLREMTERLSDFLNRRVKDHISTLSPLLLPGRVFGKHVGAREGAPRADEALVELSEKYTQACGSPFDFKPELESDVLSGIGITLQVYPYEYSYEAKGSKATKSVAMTCPVKWVVTYASEFSLSQMRSVLASPGQRRSASVRQFLVNTLAFQVVLSRNPGVAQLLKDLRYEISVEAVPGLEKLPLTVFSMHPPSFRPGDDFLLTAVRLSGVPAFIELIDPAALRSLADPLRLKLEGLAPESA